MTSRAGLTLVELLVGLVVIGTALAAGYGAFTGVADQRERAVRAMDASSRDALVRRTITDWLRDARVTADGEGPSFRGLDAVAGDRPDDELTFLTSASVGAGDILIRLHVDADASTPESGLVAEVLEWPGGAVERIELAPAADGLEIRYLSGLGGRRWLPGWVSSNVLPLGIELTALASADDSLPPLLRRPIRVAVRSAR